MDESYLNIRGCHQYLRHNRIQEDRHSLIFIHGLGDSGLSFEPVFDRPAFASFNLLVPDLIGYGRSSAAPSTSDYRFDSHLYRLKQLIDILKLTSVTLIGHSMGGDLVTLFSQQDTTGVVKQVVNIEGALTQYDLFLSGKAVEAIEQDRFDSWFSELIEGTVYNDWGKSQSGRNYYASIRFCRPEAFRQNALDIVQHNTVLCGDYRSEIGDLFAGLKIPHMFCYGTESLPHQTLEFIEMKGIPARAFQGAGHCPMTDQEDAFYTFLHDFVSRR